MVSACEAYSANRSVYKSARERVDSKGLYGRWRFQLMGFWWTVFCKIGYFLSSTWIQLNLVIAIARKCCFVCSAVYSWSSGDKTAIFFFSIKEEANKKLASIFFNPKWWCWNDRLIDWQINGRLLNKWMLTGKLTTGLQGYKSLFDSDKKKSRS